MPRTLERHARDLLAAADIQIDGSRPWDMQVHDRRVFSRAIRGGSLGLGEAYMDGWWDAASLDGFFVRALRADIASRMPLALPVLLEILAGVLLNRQRRSRAFRIGERHYDIGNDLYEAMLGRTMTYTCGYWKDAASLDEAQEAKLDLVCRKIGLAAGQAVLDIGCGWGSFAKHAAERYGARVTGITVSREQAELARARCAGLPVDILLQDYRDVRGTYDHVVSLGMFEHVGVKNYRTYMDVARRCLTGVGFFLLHTIGGNVSAAGTDPWIGKYIFPDSMLPSIAQIGRAIEGRFVMEDWHNFGPDYDRTLLAWDRNLETAWDSLPRYDARFRRMWHYYLMLSAATFRARANQLWQLVLSKCGIMGGYTSVR
jgi:cyclopropane-fatty-acyl-phospholipid synthase